MSLGEMQQKYLGRWSGENLLRLSWETPSEFRSPSELSADLTAKGAFLTITYTWSHANVLHEGFLLIGHDANDSVVTAAWVDSWHMSGKVLFCRGTLSKDGVIDVRGSYEAPPDPDWGWRIVLTRSGERLQMQMYNCPPTGGEDLAVQADYARKSR